MTEALGFVYGVQVQNLTGILKPSSRGQAEAASPALKLDDQGLCGPQPWLLQHFRGSCGQGQLITDGLG